SNSAHHPLTLSLPDALPIWCWTPGNPATAGRPNSRARIAPCDRVPPDSMTSPRALTNSGTHAGSVDGQTRMYPPSSGTAVGSVRSEEHTSELQSPDHLVCRL